MSEKESSEDFIPEEEKKVIEAFEEILGEPIPDLNEIQYHNVEFWHYRAA